MKEIVKIYSKNKKLLVTTNKCGHIVDLVMEKIPYANLSHQEIYGWLFMEADLTFSDFSYSNLYWASFSGANLSYANFTRAHCSGVYFDGADLSSAILNGCIFDCGNMGAYTDFSGCNLSNITFDEFTRFDFTTYNEATIFPKDLVPEKYNMVLKK